MLGYAPANVPSSSFSSFFFFLFLCLCGFKFRMEESRLSSSFFLSLLNEHTRARLYNYTRHCKQFEISWNKERNFLSSPSSLLLLSFLPLDEERNFFLLYRTNTERTINCYNLRRYCKQFEISWIYRYQTLVFLSPSPFFFFFFSFRRVLSFEFQKKILDFNILTSAMRKVLPLRFFPIISWK